MNDPDRLSAPFERDCGRGVSGWGHGDTLAADLLRRFDSSIVERTTERAAILEHDAGLSRAAAEAAVCDLYVASDLDAWPAPVVAELGRTGYAPQVVSDGKTFRRLDADWYGYLFGQMEKAKGLAAAGTMDAAVWERLRERFAVIHRFAALKGCAVAPSREVAA
jgi:hypothetical protein